MLQFVHYTEIGYPKDGQGLAIVNFHFYEVQKMSVRKFESSVYMVYNRWPKDEIQGEFEIKEIDFKTPYIEQSHYPVTWEMIQEEEEGEKGVVDIIYNSFVVHHEQDVAQHLAKKGYPKFHLQLIGNLSYDLVLAAAKEYDPNAVNFDPTTFSLN